MAVTAASWRDHSPVAQAELCVCERRDCRNRIRQKRRALQAIGRTPYCSTHNGVLWLPHRASSRTINRGTELRPRRREETAVWFASAGGCRMCFWYNFSYPPAYLRSTVKSSQVPYEPQWPTADGRAEAKGPRAAANRTRQHTAPRGHAAGSRSWRVYMIAFAAIRPSFDRRKPPSPELIIL